MNDHEKGFVDAFVHPRRQPRHRALLEKPKRRIKFTSLLAHFHDFDDRCITGVPPTDQYSEPILQILRDKRAPDTCWVISEDYRLDGKEMSLVDALDEIVGFGSGTVISCIPGQLAYYEGEDPGRRFILERRQQ